MRRAFMLFVLFVLVFSSLVALSEDEAPAVIKSCTTIENFVEIANGKSISPIVMDVTETVKLVNTFRMMAVQIRELQNDKKAKHITICTFLSHINNRNLPEGDRLKRAIELLNALVDQDMK